MAHEPVTESLHRDESTKKSLLKRREYLRLSAAATAVGAVTGTALSGSAAAQRSDSESFNQQLNAVDDLGMDPEGNDAIDTALIEETPSNTLIEFPAGEYLVTDAVVADVAKRFGIAESDSPGDVTFTFASATQESTDAESSPVVLSDEEEIDLPLEAGGTQTATVPAGGQPTTSTLLVYREDSFEMHGVELADSEAERTKTLSIVGPSDDIANYRLTVTGRIDADDENGTQQSSSLPSSSVEDALGDTVHHYEYTGEIVSFDLDGPATVTVDDERVTPEDVVADPSDRRLPDLLVVDTRKEQSGYELRLDD
ncbi:hypothetical protein SAMN04487950_0670 [Halogranum rubrum]|uniref:Tat (Twin-arginine translocation) pathway signal sequence n=2 Tax=Halogranum rubrum TaxID=553466 RepID=A0A1I4BPC6_9EURY|nr:hypothetical protein SAMN04487950_0670 [Halogranum rubrum]